MDLVWLLSNCYQKTSVNAANPHKYWVFTVLRFIPSQPNFLSTKGLNLLLRSIAKIKRQINPRLRIDGILLTMVDNRTNNAKSIITSLRSSVGENIRVFESEIPFSVRAAECSLSGESIFSHDKNGKVAAAYEALTKEVTEIEERAKNRPGPDWIR